MTDTIKKTTFEAFKKSAKDLLLAKDFNLFGQFQRDFENLSLEEKIMAFDFIKSLPQSSRKTLLFSAFVKKEKKRVSREISNLGIMI